MLKRYKSTAIKQKTSRLSWCGLIMSVMLSAWQSHCEISCFSF